MTTQSDPEIHNQIETDKIDQVIAAQREFESDMARIRAEVHALVSEQVSPQIHEKNHHE